jgi:hypothetical protein
MTKLSANNIYRKAKETGIGWSYVGVHYTPEVFQVATAKHHNKLTSPKRDTYFLQTLDGRSVMSSTKAAVPMEFFGNDLLKVPVNRIATHIKPTIGDASIRQANYLNRLIKKKPKAKPPQANVSPQANPQEQEQDYGQEQEQDYGHNEEQVPNQQEAAPRTRSKKALPIPLTDVTPIRFQQVNPKKVGSKSYGRYEMYKRSKSVKTALEAGATRADIKWDKERGYLTK